MTLIRYIGPHDAVELPGGLTCARGDTVEVSPMLAPGLLDQPGNWLPADVPAPDPDAEELQHPAPADADQSSLAATLQDPQSKQT